MTHFNTTTSSNSLITLVEDAITHDRTELLYWKSSKARNRKVVRNYIAKSEESLNNLMKLRTIIKNSEQ